jgi:hypothetical protein
MACVGAACALGVVNVDTGRVVVIPVIQHGNSVSLGTNVFVGKKQFMSRGFRGAAVLVTKQQWFHGVGIFPYPQQHYSGQRVFH